MNPWLVGVGAIWLVFGLSEFIMPQAAQFVFDMALRRPRVLPVIRLGMGLGLIVGSLREEERLIWVIGLGLAMEIAGLISMVLSDSQLQSYIYWLRSRPAVTFRIVGGVNTILALLLLLEALG